MWWIFPSMAGITKVSSTRAATRSPPNDALVNTLYTARTWSPDTVYSGVVVAAMIRNCVPRLRLRRK